MYQEAKQLRLKISNKATIDQLKQEIQKYEMQKDLQNESQKLMPEEVVPSRRYTVKPNIKTRSLTNKEK